MTSKRTGFLLCALILLVAFNGISSAPTLINPIVFVKQAKVNHSGGAIQDLVSNFEGANPAVDQPVGGGLYLLLTSGEVKKLVNRSNIAVRDPEVSFDAQRVIFAMKQGGAGKWQVWEVGINGDKLRKISRDATVNDFDPAYLPDGRIVFLSDRRKIAEPYANYPTAQMHVMNKNGLAVKAINLNDGGHINPVASDFGAILFSEFDTHDRRSSIREPLDKLAVNRVLPWLVYGDGSGFDHPLFGSHTIRDYEGGYVSVRSIPNTGQLIGVLAELKNTFGAGSIVRMDYSQIDDKERPQFLTPDVYGIRENNRLGRWRDAYPMSDGNILASYAEGAVYQKSDSLATTDIPNFKIVMLSGDGKQQQTVHEDPAFWSLQPVEVVSRPEPFLYPGFAQTKFRYAMINSLDVFNRGPNAPRVVNGDRQPAPKRGTPLTVKFYRTEKRPGGNPDFPQYSEQRFVPLGEAPVYPDGSFAALVPVDVPISWELVNARGEVVVQERFGTILKGGEVRTCYGCHAPHNGRTGNTANQAQHFATNLTNQDADTDKNGVIDILESRIIFFPDVPVPVPGRTRP